ncbi:MAG: GNAT family N-acetyltransferase [Ruminococcus sp.]|nr:GNAT family N-acetyltransferase [Ruminococcus sp.]
MSLRGFFKKLPVIETENYILREITLDDADDYGKCIADEKTYKYWGYKMTEEEKSVIGKIRYNKLAREKHSELVWGICDRKTGKIIGEFLLFHFKGTREKPQVLAEIGYRISPEMWGKGVAGEVIGGAVKYIFENTRLEKLSATVIKDNEASKKALLKNGFQTEGLIRHGKVYEVIADYYLLGILRDEVA